MLENFLDFFEIFSILDFIFLFFLLINSLISLSNGFILSLLSFLKWVIALILTKIFLPIIKPYTENLINSEFTHDIIFGSIIFICHHSVGRAIISTSITIVFGFSILSFSNFIPTIYFGLFTGLAMITALVLVLTLLPRLLIQFAPTNER